MMSFIVNYDHQKVMTLVAEITDEQVMDTIVSNNFQLNDYIKQQDSILQTSKNFVVDLEAIDNDSQMVVAAINSYLILYAGKLIIIAAGRQPGDLLLSQIVSMGIYNICTATDKEELAEEVAYCIQSGKTYRDSGKFLNPQELNELKPVEKPTKEKIIVKNQTTVKRIADANKVSIGISGTQSRMGVTTLAMHLAETVKKRNFHVCVVEILEKDHQSAFLTFEDAYDLENKGAGIFNMDGIDYFSGCDLKSLPDIIASNYNFVVIDFGVFRREIVSEFSRCTIPLLVAGIKPWEMPAVNAIFGEMEQKVLEGVSFIFNFTPDNLQDDVRAGMYPLKKIFFQPYHPDPFDTESKSVATDILNRYMSSEQKYVKEQEERGGLFAKIIQKYKK